MIAVLFAVVVVLVLWNFTLHGLVVEAKRDAIRLEADFAGLEAEFVELQELVAQGVLGDVPKPGHAQAHPPARAEDEARHQTAPST